MKDTNGVEILLIVLAGVGAVILGYLSWLADKRRRAAIVSFAKARGWTYRASNHRYCRELSGDPFGKGDNRRAENVVRGDFQGRTVIAFDYRYDTHHADGNGRRRRTTHRFHVIEVVLPVALPTVSVSREHLLHKVGNTIGFTDIELESEGFNRRFRVTAEDRKLAFDILHPRTMETLIAADGPAWRIERDRMLTWSEGKLMPSVIEPALNALCQVLDQVPSFVWKDQDRTTA